jgi:hypothetical protein
MHVVIDEVISATTDQAAAGDYSTGTLHVTGRKSFSVTYG